MGIFLISFICPWSMSTMNMLYCDHCAVERNGSEVELQTLK